MDSQEKLDANEVCDHKLANELKTCIDVNTRIFKEIDRTFILAFIKKVLIESVGCLIINEKSVK